MVSDIEKRIIMRFEAIDKASSEFAKQTRNAEKFNNEMRKNALNNERQTKQKLKNDRLTSLANREKLSALKKKGRVEQLAAKQEKDRFDLSRRFRMELLGILFAGMALQRATMGFLRSAVTAYNKAFTETNAFQAATNKLIASWTFFKFRLIDVLAQNELFRKFVDFLVGLVDALADLDPSALLLIITSVAAAGVVGSTFMVAASILLGLASLKIAFPGAELAIAGFIKKVGPITNFAKLLSTGLGVFFIYEGFKDVLAGDFLNGLISIIGGAAFLIGGFKWGITIWVALKFVEPAIKELQKITNMIQEKLGVDLGKATATSFSEALQKKMRATGVPGVISKVFGFLSSSANKGREVILPGTGIGFNMAKKIADLTLSFFGLNFQFLKAKQQMEIINPQFNTMSANLEKIDKKLVKESVVPSMGLLNMEFGRLLFHLIEVITIIPSLILQLNLEEEAHITNTDAINAEADALERLASIKGISSGGGGTEQTSGSRDPSRRRQSP